MSRSKDCICASTVGSPLAYHTDALLQYTANQ